MLDIIQTPQTYIAGHLMRLNLMSESIPERIIFHFHAHAQNGYLSTMISYHF